MSQIILDSANDLIQGDFDNATLSQRTRLQTSTTNATTGVYVVPNGTATSASVQVSNAADPTNASKVVLATNGSTDTQIVSGANGSGTYLPLSIYTNNDIRLQVNNSGALGVRTGPGTVGFGTAGQVLTSNGSGAGVSWNTAASGQFRNEVFTAPGTFTIPSSATTARVTVIGGGGGGGGGSLNSGGNGGDGGLAVSFLTGLSGSYPITVGSGGSFGASPNSPAGSGSPGGAGGTSSFSSLISATGGGGGLGSPGPASGSPGATGTGTVSSGTAFISNTNRSNASFTYFAGGARALGQAAGAYTATGGYGAGVSGPGGPGSGTPRAGAGGTGGIVLVEYVG